MKLSKIEVDIRELIESIAEGLISELEEVAQVNNLPTNKQDLKELAIQAIERV